MEIKQNVNQLNEENCNYKIIKSIYKTKYGELFLISFVKNENEVNKLYILNKIDIKTEAQKEQIEKEILMLKKIKSKYIIEIINYFIGHEEGKEKMYIIFNYYENNLSKIISQKTFYNSRNIWKFFIQIIFG